MVRFIRIIWVVRMTWMIRMIGLAGVIRTVEK